MRLRALTTFVISLLAAASIASAQTSTITKCNLGDVTDYRLSNGLQVLVAPSHAADLVTVDAWVGAGTRRESPETNGVAHFMEHLLFKGTKTRMPGAIDAEIEDLGGSMNAATSYDWAHFYVTVGASDAAQALSILSDALRNAELRQQDIDAERPVILNEMARDSAEPMAELSQIINEMVFGPHPYARPLLGTESNVSGMQRQTILNFYHTYYVPSNVTLVLSGNLTPAQGLAMAQTSLGDWQDHAVPQDHITPAPVQTEVHTRTLPGSGNNAYLMLGFPAPSVKSPDAYAMDVLLTLLGQGGINRLQEHLQYKQKLVTEITANYLTQQDPGVLTIFAECSPENLDAVRDAILHEVDDLKVHPISDAELAEAKQQLIASYLFDVQTTSGRANALGFYNIIDSYRYDTDYIPHFQGVSADDLVNLARRYLDSSTYSMASIVPEENPIVASSIRHSLAAR